MNVILLIPEQTLRDRETLFNLNPQQQSNSTQTAHFCHSPYIMSNTKARKRKAVSTCGVPTTEESTYSRYVSLSDGAGVATLPVNSTFIVNDIANQPDYHIPALLQILEQKVPSREVSSW